MSTSGEPEIIYSEIQLKCGTCDAYVDTEDLFCANCGAEAPETGHKLESTDKFKHSYGCPGCGASMNYDADVQNLACPFCGNQKVQKEKSQKSAKPKWVIPFQIDRTLAQNTLRAWLGKSFWRPKNLASMATITKINAVYVPYWCFKADTLTYWTADSSYVPWSARSSWRPIAGEHSDRYDGIMVGASSALTIQETLNLCPYYLEDCRTFEDFDFSDWLVELAKVPRKFARPQARLQLEERERKACRKYVPGKCRNMKVNVRLHSLEGRIVMLPVWILSYQYKDHSYRFLINGQTNQCTGTAPTSYWKLFLVIAGGGMIAFIVLLLIGMLMAAA